MWLRPLVVTSPPHCLPLAPAIAVADGSGELRLTCHYSDVGLRPSLVNSDSPYHYSDVCPKAFSDSVEPYAIAAQRCRGANAPLTQLALGASLPNTL